MEILSPVRFRATKLELVILAEWALAEDNAIFFCGMYSSSNWRDSPSL